MYTFILSIDGHESEHVVMGASREEAWEFMMIMIDPFTAVGA